MFSVDEDTRLVLYYLVNGLGRMVGEVIVIFWLVLLVLEIFIYTHTFRSI